MTARAGGMRAALDDVAGLGPFFAVSANPAEAVDDSWRPLGELYDDLREDGPLPRRIRFVATALGTEDLRVAASIAYQGLAARLVSPVLAVAAVHGLVPPWTPESLHWRHAVSGPWPLWESGPPEPAPEPEQAPRDTSRRVVEALVGPHLVALAAATRAVVSVSERTLWGNAASAVVAAADLVARSRPPAGHRIATITDAVLASGPLAGAGGFEAPGRFRRRSCCLYYRIPGGGTCGDCVLTGSPAQRRRPGGTPSGQD